jgi:esterase/lipase
MALQDPIVFVQLVAETASTHNTTPEEVFEKVLDQWWRQVSPDLQQPFTAIYTEVLV